MIPEASKRPPEIFETPILKKQKLLNDEIQFGKVRTPEKFIQ